MKSLKQLVNELTDLGCSDIEIIKLYLQQTGMSIKAFELMVNICKDQIIDLENFKEKQLMWNTMSYSYYYDLYPKEIAYKLDSLTRCCICEVPLSKTNIKWAKETLPNYDLQAAFFQPLLEELHSHNIYFKNEKRE